MVPVSTITNSSDMRTFFLIFSALFLSRQLTADDYAGKHLSNISTAFNTVYTYPASGNLSRTVCMKGDQFERNFTYLYTDPSGIVQIQLPEGYAFAEEMYYDIDTTLQVSISDFSEGMAVIRDIKTGLMGYINKQGEIVIPAQYNQLGKFSEGLAYFAKLESCLGGETRPNKMGYINTSNEKVILLPKKLSELYGCCYFYGEPFSKGKALMYMREYGFDCNCNASFTIDRSGKILKSEGELYDVNYKPVKID